MKTTELKQKVKKRRKAREIIRIWTKRKTKVNTRRNKKVWQKEQYSKHQTDFASRPRQELRTQSEP